MFAGAFTGRKVWVSGHTGFKGAWLSEWLLSLGAKVHGFSLPPPTSPALFDRLNLADRVEHEFGDVRDVTQVVASIQRFQPDFVFHLAAQSLVRHSYTHPVETYSVNILGTAHVLEGLRQLQRSCSAVMITTDKCYENREWSYGYREEDPLGGYDPYSSSKAAAELVIHAYRRSYFGDSAIRVASARAGNVIGGGDYATDRIVPDCIRSLEEGRKIKVRNPHATRPWQHVLEPLSGYLWLAAVLAGHGKAHLNGYEPRAAFNLGPGPDANRSVSELVEEVLKSWPGAWEAVGDSSAVHEASFLQLCGDKARQQLKWSPVLQFSEAVAFAVNWYRRARETSAPAELSGLTRGQIENYCQLAKHKQLLWSIT